MSDKIKLSQLKGKALEIGTKVDNANKKDYELAGSEISIFFAECQNNNVNIKDTNWFNELSDDSKNKFWDLQDLCNKSVPEQSHTLPNDNTRVFSIYKTEFSTKNDKTDLEPKFENSNYTHEQVVSIMADSWAETYGVDNSDKSFTKFVEKVYKVAKNLNITKPNEKFDKRFPTVEDQIVDEILAAFANESRFDPKKLSANGLYHGIFQFSKIGMKELQLQNSKLKILSMNDFRKLSRLEQLDYMEECVKYSIEDKRYSNIKGKQISPKEMYAMWVLPTGGRDSNVKLQNKKAAQIRAKQAERGKLVFPQ